VLQDLQGTPPADPPATQTTFPNFLLKFLSSQEALIQLNQMFAEIETRIQELKVQGEKLSIRITLDGK